MGLNGIMYKQQSATNAYHFISCCLQFGHVKILQYFTTFFSKTQLFSNAVSSFDNSLLPPFYKNSSPSFSHWCTPFCNSLSLV